MGRLKKGRIDNRTWRKWKVDFYDTNYDDLMKETGLTKPTIIDAIIRGVATTDTKDSLTEAFGKLLKKKSA